MAILGACKQLEKMRNIRKHYVFKTWS